MKMWANRGKLFISFEIVEVNVHRGQMKHIFSCCYVCILDIMVDKDKKLKIARSSL